MFDSLLWVLPHFITHYAGQTTQGNTNDDDGANQPSGSKDAPKQDTDLPLRIHPVYLSRALWGTEVPDQSGAPASPPADPRPEEECRGLRWLRKLFGLCPQQPSPSQPQPQPEPQPSTLHDPPQSDGMPLPVYVGRSEAQSYSQDQDADQYNAFTKGEAEYFELEYSPREDNR
ncbi:hypothetical protein BASA62_009977 [Batrachochytrium salamandrivorans]|nr:hypothetical protein BASA62_009977 [Batrachochytrium salamandrivorans]